MGSICIVGQPQPTNPASRCLSLAHHTAINRKVVLVGLDGAGKTTLFNQLVGRDTNLHRLPLTGKGFQSQTIHLHGSGVALWDLDGKDHTDIQHWRHHYTGTDGFVFVLDSGDEDTLDHACVEFVSAMSDDQLSSASVLVLANKSDLPRTASVSEIQSKLGLIDASTLAGNRPFLVCAVSAITGQGVEKAFELLFRSMSGL